MGRILILEDEEKILHLYELNLTARNHIVLTYRTGADGLDGIHTQQPDLVLLNMRIPGDLSGWDVLDAMRADDSLHDIPVIIITGAIEEFQSAYTDHPQVAHVLLKPLRLDRLLALIDEELEQPEA